MDGLAEDEFCRFRPPKSVQEEDSLLVQYKLKVHGTKTRGVGAEYLIQERFWIALLT